MSPLIDVPCSLCGATDADPLYRREHETGSSLGRLELCLVLCSHCGFLFASPRPDEAALESYYRGAAHASGRTFRDVGGGSRQAGLLEDRVGFLRNALPKAEKPGATALRLLDVGCGRGDFLAAMRSPGLACSGLEPSPEAVRVARAQGFEVHAERLENTTLPGAAFDVVTCISALEHAFDPAVFLSDLAALVKSDGWLFIEVPDSLRPVAQVSEFFSFEHLSHFTEATLRFALARSGLETLATERCPRTSALRCIARKTESAAPLAPPADNADELRTVLADYSAQRRRLERDLIANIEPRVERWRADGARIAIFGAGVHTRFLLDLIDFGDAVSAVLDSDPTRRGERFLNWEVRSPEDIPSLQLDAIVVSSKAYQEEIVRSLDVRLAGSRCEVVGCYASPQPSEEAA